MSKVKNSRKGTQEEDMDDISVESGEEEQPKGKGGKKAQNQVKDKNKGKPQKTARKNSDGDTDSDEEEEEYVPKGKPKSKIHSVFALLGDEGDEVGSGKDSDDSEVESKPAPKKKPAKEKGKKAQKESFDDDIAEDADGIEAETIVKPDKKSGKKSKKDKKKKEDDDLEKLLEELGMQKPDDLEEAKGDAGKESEKAGKKKKKKKEESKSEALLESAIEDLTLEDTRVENGSEVNDEPKETADDKAESGNESGQDDDDVGVKSAAQKRKEKREREKQKKKAEKAKQQKPQSKEEPDETATIEIETTAEAVDDEAKADDDAATGTGDKKKKKGAKDKDKDKDKKKSKPGNKQIELIREAQRKIEEEKERLRKEEEDKFQAEEERELRREEEKRLDQERRDKKKQEEKDKKERLKAEGKFQTKAQKEKSARILAHFRAQGFLLPEVGESPKDPAKAKQGQKKPKKERKGSNINNEQKIDETAAVTTEPLTPTSEPKPEEEVKDSWEQESEGEGVKDSWDVSSGEDEQTKINTQHNAKKPPGPKAKPKNVKKQASTSEESDSDDDSEDDSEDETSESDSEPEQKYSAEKLRERAVNRIQKRRIDNEANRSMDKLRSPVVCVLGHVDTGKTKILDKIRHTHVQDQEAGGITQQIGATFVPVEAIKEQAKMVKLFDIQIKVPGLLIIDTPGHESFSNLRSRGSSLCDMAILVVDIMHGLEPQTIESINLLKNKKTPFIVALNKVDRLYDWKSNKNKDIRDLIKTQGKNTQLEYEERVKEAVVQFAEQGLNATLFYDNQDLRSYVSMVPTSAATGDGMGNLIALVTELTQTMLTKRLMFSDELQATVLEVKAIAGLGTTIDLILINGKLHEGDTIIIAGTEGPLVTQIRSLLMPQPLKELRVKNAYQEYKEIAGAQGIKLTGKELDKAIAGLNLLVASLPDEVEICKDEVAKELHQAMNSIKLVERGVFVQASTLGSLEALVEFLKKSSIPYAGIRIGPVVKKDVMKASIMLEHDSQYAVILAFDVKVERDAQDLADSLGVKIFCADIIYHLFDKFMAYRDELKAKKRDEFKHVAVFPCKLKILPQFIFNSRDPIIMGVSVEAGVLKHGTPICVPGKEFLEIGTVTTIEINHKTVDTARKGQEVCIKVEPSSGDSPKMYGRHFDHTDQLVSKVTRQSIDACKEYFRDDLQKTDWQLMVELKKLFQIL